MNLHVLNGDSMRTTLEKTDVPGDVTVWADVLHDGPAPAGLSDEEWRAVRARHLASQGHGDEWKIREELCRWDDCLARHADYEEVVFWLEHDLFDQLLLIRHLHWMSAFAERARFRLICIDRFPGHPKFAGLGELSPVELASLFPRRQPLTSQQIELGASLWRAFGAADPRPFSQLVLNSDNGVLPFASGALTRQLEDFPSTADGLARTERQILAAIRDGHRSAVDVFLTVSGFEERIFMGDATFWTWMRRMTEGRVPLIALDGAFHDNRAPSGTFTLTDAGRMVLDRQADCIDLNGIDRWMGGVHLIDGRYRWTGTEITLTRTPSRS